LTEYLRAVRPLPKTSSTAEKRGAQSFQLGRFSIASNRRAGTKRPAGDSLASTWALMFSQRMPAFTVSRLSRHESCTYTPRSRFRRSPYLSGVLRMTTLSGTEKRTRVLLLRYCCVRSAFASTVCQKSPHVYWTPALKLWAPQR
jgi:hypothetical protein